MADFKLLVVEDSEQDLTACRDSIERYNDEKERDVKLIECRSVDEAFKELDNSFDGAIIDLKLADEGNEGNVVLEKIKEAMLRIPVAVFTGTPDVADPASLNFGVFKKGETSYAELLDKFWGIHASGMTRIMGGRGKIEETLNMVYQNNLLPQKDVWVEYGEVDSTRAEEALLRHALGHLLQLLDDDAERCFPEEVFLHPPLTEELKTGSVVIRKKGEQAYVVLNPSCDLVVRENGEFKTERIMLVEIEQENGLVEACLEGVKEKKKQNCLKNVLGNNHAGYYHWLPATSFFAGGFINFRKIETMSKDSFDKLFNAPSIQISQPFIKDIVSRFSSYYARQGQPDIEMQKAFDAHL